MRRVIAVLLLCLLSHQLLLKLGIVAWYEWNKDYVAQNLCENRDKPQLKCCGKCYLQKQLAKANTSSKADEALVNKLSKAEVSAFILPAIGLHLTQPTYAMEQELLAYNMPFAEEVTLAVTQPPG